MRKLIMKMSVSVDGFVGGPRGEGDWIFRSSDENSMKWAASKILDVGLIIMGRKSFEGMANYWPTATGPFARPMNEIPKAVFTRKGFDPGQILQKGNSAASISWSEARVIRDDFADSIQKLKSEDGKSIYALGGAEFMRSLIEAGLIDEYHLAIHPVVLGSGQTIFDSVPQPRDLKLMDARSFPGGIVVHSYEK